jgi:hypothetical protein
VGQGTSWNTAAMVLCVAAALVIVAVSPLGNFSHDFFYWWHGKNKLGVGIALLLIAI